LVRLSHLSPTYLQWLHAKLPGAGNWEGADGASRLQKAICAFQAKHPPLKQDDWIGAKTETALIAVYGEPPGNGGPPPAPAPAPEWLQVWNALPIQMR